jgi:AAA family ATP:ADP antiporter
MTAILLGTGICILGLIVAIGFIWGFVSLLQKITDKQELKKFVMLGLIFCLIIGAYWMLRPLKDSFFGVIVGKGYRGYAKNLSVILISVLVIVYSKLLDIFPKKRVLYILTTCYAIALFIFMLFFMHPTIGIANTVASPYRIIGWIWYSFVESIGSLVAAAFWAFTTDITMPEVAKRGFPILALFAQLGNIGGPLTTVLLIRTFGSGIPFVGIAGVVLFCAGPLVWFFLRVTPKEYLVGFHDAGTKKEEPGFFDGLKLLMTTPYLLCIFAIVSMFEILNTILDIMLKDWSLILYPIELENTLFISKFAVAVGIIATLSLILRIGELPKILGIRMSLFLLPILVVTGFVVINITNSFGYLLPGLFIVVASFRAINYAFNAPTCKQLYIPTTKDVKYKAQAWIDTFGSRIGKAGGGTVNIIQQFASSVTWQLLALLALSTGIVGLIWLPAVWFASKKYGEAIKKNEVVC